MPKSKDKKNKLGEPLVGGKCTKKQDDLKKKKLPKVGSLTDGIEMSKQLTRKISSRKRGNKPNRELRICGNGKPMPSLAELEKMFEDSDDNDDSTSNISTNDTERCKTPVYDIDTQHITNISPKSLKKLSSKVFDVVTTISNSLASLKEPSLPKLKQKQSRKRNLTSSKAYSETVIEPNISFIDIESDHAMDINESQGEDDCPQKRRKVSKSIIKINQENSEKQDVGEVLSDGSTDSIKTVSYDYTNSSFDTRNQHRSFSPLPSTSKDNDTFLQNVKRFNESLQYDKISTSDTSDLEIIEIPCETIILDTSKNLNSCLEVIEIDVQEQNNGGQSPNKIHSPTAVDDYYSSIDLNQNYDLNVCETVDIDEVMAENRAIIEKYNNISRLNTVTEVKPNPICEKQLSSNLENKPPNCSVLDGTSLNIVAINKDNVAIQGNMSKTKNDNSVEFIDSNLSSTNTEPSSNNRNKIEEIVTVFFESQRGNNKIQQNCNNNELIDRSSSVWNDTIKQWVSDIDQNNISKLKSTTSSTMNGKQLISKSDFNISDISIIDITSDYITSTPQPARPRNYDVILLNPSREQSRQTIRQCNDVPILVDSYSSDSLGTRDNSIQIIDIDDTSSTSPIYLRNVTVTNNVIREGSNHHRINEVEMIRNFSNLDHNYMTVNDNHDNTDVIRNASLDHNYLTPNTDINQKNKKSKRNTKTKNNVQDTEKSIENETPRSISDCPICMENMSNKEIASTMCGHLFCMKCIKAAIKASGRKCPTCRKALKGVGYHQIFL